MQTLLISTVKIKMKIKNQNHGVQTQITPIPTHAETIVSLWKHIHGLQKMFCFAFFRSFLWNELSGLQQLDPSHQILTWDRILWIREVDELTTASSYLETPI